MTSGQDRTKRIRRYPVICLLITLAIGFPQRAFTATDQYKPAVPVIDYIEKERPQGSVTRFRMAKHRPRQLPGAVIRHKRIRWQRA